MPSFNISFYLSDKQAQTYMDKKLSIGRKVRELIKEEVKPCPSQ